MTYENVAYWFELFMSGIGFLVLCYTIPYFIRRGWLQGENDTSKSRRVCDVCFRDLHKLNEAVKKPAVYVDDQ